MTRIPISEDELTGILFSRMSGTICDSSLEARSLARKMIASELMYEALKAPVAVLSSFRVGYYEENADYFRSRLGDIACLAGEVLKQIESALSAADKGNA